MMSGPYGPYVLGNICATISYENKNQINSEMNYEVGFNSNREKTISVNIAPVFVQIARQLHLISGFQNFKK